MASFNLEVQVSNPNAKCRVPQQIITVFLQCQILSDRIIAHSICNIFSGNLSVRHPDLDAGNKLKLNNDKTEALLLHSSSKSFLVSKPTTISICGCEISFSPSARNLGFYIRDDMSVELHIKNVCWSAYPELRQISTISASSFSWLHKNTCVHLCPL